MSKQEQISLAMSIVIVAAREWATDQSATNAAVLKMSVAKLREAEGK